MIVGLDRTLSRIEAAKRPESAKITNVASMNTPDKKPGNMYKNLGETDAERAANLKIVKAWVGEGAWNLNRWAKRGDVPGITKEQLDKLKLAY